jgi:outer membrane protein assembly factor BamB
MRMSLVLAAVLAASCLAMAADWPQFLGPDRNNIAPDTGLAKTWPEKGPKVLWTVPVNTGFGAPAVQGGKVYLLDRVEGA